MMMAVLPPTMNALSSMPNHDDELDALSSDDDDDESDCSDDDDDDNDNQRSNNNNNNNNMGRKNQVTDFQGFEGGYDADDPIAKQMETIISLKLSLGIDNDKEFLAEHERKKAQAEKERIEKEQEAERIANMTPEERIQYESEQASSIFANVALKLKSKKYDELKEQYQWEKPEWAKQSKLKSTAKGQAVKQGQDLQGPITQAPHLKKEMPGLMAVPVKKLKHRTDNEAGGATAEKKQIGWEKPEWAKQTKLKTSAAGQAVKKGVDLQAPITQAPHIKKELPADARPPGLIPVKKLSKSREASNHAAAQPKKSIEWEKPEWAKSTKLRTTAAGEAVKKGVDLQGPITQAPHMKKDTTGNSTTQAEVLGCLKKIVKKPKDGTGGSAPGSPKKKVSLAGAKSPAKSPSKSPKGDNTQAEVMVFLKKNMKKAKSKRNLIVED